MCNLPLKFNWFDLLISQEAELLATRSSQWEEPNKTTFFFPKMSIASYYTLFVCLFTHGTPSLLQSLFLLHVLENREAVNSLMLLKEDKQIL